MDFIHQNRNEIWGNFIYVLSSLAISEETFPLAIVELMRYLDLITASCPPPTGVSGGVKPPPTTIAGRFRMLDSI